jgi:hypothetical protein
VSGRTTRGQALAAAGALAASLVLPRAALAARPGAEDRAVLERLLALEHVQAAFYTEAERVAGLAGTNRAAAAALGAAERAHVRALRSLIGAGAPARPVFDFRGATEDDDAFTSAASALEDLCVAALAAELPRIRSREVLQAAVGLRGAEARHAAWARRLAGQPPAPAALDAPRPWDAVAEELAARHPVRPEPHTTGRSVPRWRP